MAGGGAGQERPRVLGLWDVRKAPLRLGNVVILVEELKAQAEIHQADIEGVCFIHDADRPLPVPVSREPDGALVPSTRRPVPDPPRYLYC